MNLFRVTLIALGLCGAPAMAQEQLAFNDRPEVNPLPGTGNFEVIQKGAASASRAWCDAGNYAQRYLRAGATQRIFLLSKEGPAKTKKRSLGVGFTIAPSAQLKAQETRPGDGGNYSVSIRRVGFSLTVGHAKGLCNSGRFS